MNTRPEWLDAELLAECNKLRRLLAASPHDPHVLRRMATFLDLLIYAPRANELPGYGIQDFAEWREAVLKMIPDGEVSPDASEVPPLR